ncbi:DUF4245 family protein [Nocardioides sp. 616]|uniref:DUF4245 family protein n=1 Tax=Nocardioides sp. 616 TaxID=2268090 RepID=UPI000CE4D2FF|nr:DUF4245 family protein [Nocardioides sp. 616]
MSGKPARHQTSMAGMIGAMIVLVAAVLAVVLLRDLGRESAETSPDALEWESAVAGAQDTGLEVAYPARLPAGWKVTSVELEPTDPPTWAMGMLTDTGAFVGLRQQDESVRDLVETYVDDDAEEGDPVQIGGDLGGTWSTYTDEGGDTAFVLERGDDVLLVYGSAPREVIIDFAEQLTEAPRD